VNEMRLFGFDRKVVGVLFILSIAQVIGWGTLSLPAIVGRQVAADLRMDVSAVFAGTSVLYVMMGLCAPLMARPFRRFGARLVIVAGTMIAPLGFVLLALSDGPLAYFAAWAILGTSGSAALSTAAYVMLNEIAGRDAKAAIGALMLVTGLSSSIFWPIGSLLSDAIGWRGACLLYAALMALVCLPLAAFGLPHRAVSADEASGQGAVSEAPIPKRRVFYLIAAAIALNAFVTYGFAAVLIELLKAEGLAPQQAIAFGSALGVIQVGARAIDTFGGARWDGLATGLFAGIVLPAAMLLLIIGHGSYWTIMIFIVLYGLGSGAFAVARATLPLVFYDKTEFARATSHIAMPLNLIAAVSPPVLASLLERFGSNAVLGLAMLCSCGALAILFWLSRLRPVSRQIRAPELAA
jgi:predicted MFS family arabinose efflux permease